MACNTCGQSSCECKLGAYACPKLSNPPTCDELKDFKENMMDELANNREYVSGCNPDSIVRYVDSIMERISCLNDQEIIALCSIFNSIAKLRNTDVGNHMSLSADKNTLTLTRKKLDGTTVASDTVPVQLGDMWNILNNFKGADIETSKSLWKGNLAEGNALPIDLVNGAYDLTVTSPDIGAYIVRIIYSDASPINHNSIVTPYVPATSDGSFWIMQPKLTNATHPIFKTTIVKYDHASQSSSVSNSNGCHLVEVKQVVKVHIG